LHTLFADTGAWRIRNGDAQLDPIAATG